MIFVGWLMPAPSSMVSCQQRRQAGRHQQQQLQDGFSSNSGSQAPAASPAAGDQAGIPSTITATGYHQPLQDAAASQLQWCLRRQPAAATSTTAAGRQASSTAAHQDLVRAGGSSTSRHWMQQHADHQ